MNMLARAGEIVFCMALMWEITEYLYNMQPCIISYHMICEKVKQKKSTDAMVYLFFSPCLKIATHLNSFFIVTCVSLMRTSFCH